MKRREMTFWERLAWSQRILATRPSRLPRWLRILLHPFRYYRARQARLQLQHVAQAVIDSMLDSFKKAVGFLERLDMYVPANSGELQPTLSYARARRPYGNNVRGKKRWLREMKSLSRYPSP